MASEGCAGKGRLRFGRGRTHSVAVGVHLVESLEDEADVLGRHELERDEHAYQELFAVDAAVLVSVEPAEAKAGMDGREDAEAEGVEDRRGGRGGLLEQQ